jgi:hypothetical protein
VYDLPRVLAFNAAGSIASADVAFPPSTAAALRAAAASGACLT